MSSKKKSQNFSTALMFLEEMCKYIAKKLLEKKSQKTYWLQQLLYQFVGKAQNLPCFFLLHFSN